jgi:hypothetical protein
MNEKSVKSFENGRRWAIIFGTSVYIGVVLLFSAFYQDLIAEQFRNSGIVLIAIARIGAILVGLNAVALPLALHFWATGGSHRWVAIGFYAIDITVMGLNVLASAQHASNNDIAWVNTYASYAPATVVFVLLGWALLYMTDPGQRALVKLQESISSAQVSIVNRATEFINSDEGAESIVVPFASKLAARVFNERKLLGTNRSLPVSETGDEDQDTVSLIVKQVLEHMDRQKIQEQPKVIAPQAQEASQATVPFSEVTSNNSTSKTLKLNGERRS